MRWEETPSRAQVVVTWGLVFVWAVLMGFGVLTYLGPKWLQELGRSGMRIEASTYRSYGDDCVRQGQYGLAIAQYERALEIEPERVDVLLGLAVAWMKAGDKATGIEILEGLLGKETSRSASEFIYLRLGEVALSEGRTEEGIEYYQRALDLGVEQARVYCKLGLAYLGAQQDEKARVAFEMGLARQLDVSLPYKSMLQRTLDTLEYDTTEVFVIEKELSRDDQLHAIRERLAEDVGTEDLARYDLESIRSVQRSDPEIAETHSQLAFVYSRLGKLSEAIGHAQRALEIVPDSLGAKKNLELLQQMRRSQENGAAAP